MDVAGVMALGLFASLDVKCHSRPVQGFQFVLLKLLHRLLLLLLVNLDALPVALDNFFHDGGGSNVAMSTPVCKADHLYILFFLTLVGIASWASFSDLIPLHMGLSLRFAPWAGGLILEVLTFILTKLIDLAGFLWDHADALNVMLVDAGLWLPALLQSLWLSDVPLLGPWASWTHSKIIFKW